MWLTLAPSELPTTNHQSYSCSNLNAFATKTFWRRESATENVPLLKSQLQNRLKEINIIVQYCLEMNGNLVRVIIRKQVAVVSVNISTSSQDITCWWNNICATCVSKVFQCSLFHSCFLASFCHLENILRILGIINLLCAWNVACAQGTR